jgi:hypothetical protein
MQKGYEMTDPVSMQSLRMMAQAPTLGSRAKGTGNWFEAFANAWGQALDNQAAKIETASDNLEAGGDKPSDITKLSAESMRMSFMSNASHTSLDSVSKALETMARKS